MHMLNAVVDPPSTPIGNTDPEPHTDTEANSQIPPDDRAKELILKIEQDSAEHADNVLSYIEVSFVFGTFFLAGFMYKEVAEEKRRWLPDALMLVLITLCQPVIYGLFMWAIWTGIEAGPSPLWCPEDRETSGNANAFYFMLLAMYTLKLCFELKGSLDMWLQARRACELIETGTEDGTPEDILALNVFYLATFWRTCRVGTFIDHAWHVIGWHILILISVTAMFFEGTVGGMVLNAAAVLYLGELDDEFKARILAYPSMKIHIRESLQDIAKENGEEAANADKEDNYATHKQVTFLFVFHILMCTALMSWIVFLAVQTGSNCKPTNSPIKLFGS